MPPKKKGGLSKKKRLSVFEIQYIEKGISCLADTNNRKTNSLNQKILASYWENELTQTFF